MTVSQAQEILENASLVVIAPEDPAVDAASLLSVANGNLLQNGAASSIEELPQRNILFFDEVIDVLVVLQAPGTTADELESLAQQLVISLEAVAVGTRRSSAPDTQDDKSPTFKDVLSSWTNAEDDSTSNLACSPSSNNGGQSTPGAYACWSARVHLNRARIRSSNPSLYFSASATVRPDNSSSYAGADDEYLPSGVPASMNLFDAFQHDPVFKGNPPVLPASTLSKILPTGIEGRDQPRILRSSSRPLTQLVPAFRSRTRCSRVGASPNHAKVLACLDIDISPFIDGHIDLDDPMLVLADGLVESMGNPRNLTFPLRCNPHDSLSFAYNLKSSRRLAAGTDDMSPYALNVLVEAKLVYPNGITMQLKSNSRISVDLSVLHTRPYFLQPEKPLPPLTSQPKRSSTQSQADSLSHLITISLSSPPTTKVGATLTWSILLANRSSTRTLDLAIIPITHSDSSPIPSTGHSTAPPKRHTHKPTLSTSLFTASGKPTAASAPHESSGTSRAPQPLPAAATAGMSGDGFPPDASPVPASESDEPSLISLTPDIRTGALRPGASISTSMQFLVLRAGVVRVQAVRVVDLSVGGGGGRNSMHAEAGTEVAPGAERRDGRPFVDLRGALLPDVVALDADGDGRAQDD